MQVSSLTALSFTHFSPVGACPPKASLPADVRLDVGCLFSNEKERNEARGDVHCGGGEHIRTNKKTTAERTKTAQEEKATRAAMKTAAEREEVLDKTQAARDRVA